MSHINAKLLIALCALSAASAVEVFGVDYRQQDKQGHFVLGAMSAGAAILTLDMFAPDAPWYARALVGTVTAAVVGAVKEYADSRDPLNHNVELDDFVATTTGGSLLSLTFCWRF